MPQKPLSTPAKAAVGQKRDIRHADSVSITLPFAAYGRLTLKLVVKIIRERLLRTTWPAIWGWKIEADKQPLVYNMAFLVWLGGVIFVFTVVLSAAIRQSTLPRALFGGSRPEPVRRTLKFANLERSFAS